MKKIMLIAVMAVAALALPALASAAYTDNHVAITKEATVPLTGTANFSGGTNCSQATATLTLTNSTTAEVTAFSVDSPESKCTVIGTLAALGCEKLVSATATGLPYAIDNETTKAKVTGIDLDNVYKGGGFCPTAVTLSGSITVTPDNPDTISDVTLSGELTSSVLGIKAVVTGTMHPVNASDVKTYGLT